LQYFSLNHDVIDPGGVRKRSSAHASNSGRMSSHRALPASAAASSKGSGREIDDDFPIPSISHQLEPVSIKEISLTPAAPPNN